MANSNEKIAPDSQQEPGSKSGLTSFPQAILNFFDKNLENFSPKTRNFIGVSMMLLLMIIALHAFIAPTYIEGHLFVKSETAVCKEMAKNYFVESGNRGFPTNDNGYWMIPVRGMMPRKITVNITNPEGQFVGNFSTIAPWPVLNAFGTADYNVTAHTKMNGEEAIIKTAFTQSKATSRFLNFLWNIQTAYADSHSKTITFSQGENKTATIPILVHLQDLGDIYCKNGGWCGSKGEARRLEAFIIQIPNLEEDVKIEYMGHIQGKGDTEWLNGGSLCGTRQQKKRLEGFAIRLVGTNADKYSICYQAHVQGVGDTAVFKDGQFAGTRGHSKSIESIKVWLEQRSESI